MNKIKRIQHFKIKNNNIFFIVVNLHIVNRAFNFLVKESFTIITTKEGDGEYCAVSALQRKEDGGEYCGEDKRFTVGYL